MRFSPTTITSSNKKRFQLAQYLLDINVLFPDVQGVSSSFFLLCRFLDHSIESNPRLISFQSGRKFCSKKITIDDGTQMNHHQGINNSTSLLDSCKGRQLWNCWAEAGLGIRSFAHWLFALSLIKAKRAISTKKKKSEFPTLDREGKEQKATPPPH